MTRTLVYREVVDLEELGRPYNHHGTTILKEAKSIFADDRSVAVVQSHKLTGTNRHSDKSWYKWKNSSERLVAISKKGKYYGRTYSGNDRRYFGTVHLDTLYRFFSGSAQAEAKFREIIEDRLGELHFDKVFPVAGHYGFGIVRIGRAASTSLVEQNWYDSDWRLPICGVAPALRSNSAKELTEELFGKTRARKDLVKAVASSLDINTVYVASQFRGLVPIDWIINFIRNTPAIRLHRNFNLYPVFKHLDQNTLRALLRSNDEGDTRFIRDLFRDPNQLIAAVETEPRIRSWRDLHDLQFVNRYSYTPPEIKHVDIKRTEESDKIHGLTFKFESNDYQLVTAGNTEDLIAWGDSMRNCIASYAHQAIKQTLVLGAVYCDNKVIANFEIRDGQVAQLLGRFNKSLDKPLKDAIIEQFKTIDIHQSSMLWG